jgi:hypothetical protein
MYGYISWLIECEWTFLDTEFRGDFTIIELLSELMNWSLFETLLASLFFTLNEGMSVFPKFSFFAYRSFNLFTSSFVVSDS